MKIDFSKPITDLAGNPVSAPQLDGGDPEIMTLRTIAINVLLSPMNDAGGQPENLTAVSKVKLAKLAQDIFSTKDLLDLSVDDVAMLKDRIGRACTPLTVARAFDLLDPRDD